MKERVIIRKTLFCAVLMAVCCGCAEELENSQQQENVQLEATIFENAASKTVASDEGDTYSITWTGTEKVSVNGQESSSIEVNAENPKCAVFTFSGVTAPYASVYPSSACKSVSGKTGIISIPAEQKYVSDRKSVV